MEQALIEEIRRNVATALEEDIGNGDLTAALIPVNALSTATVICREAAVISGRPWFDQVFHQIDATITVEWLVSEGEQVAADQPLCTLHGSSRNLLTGERAALNILQTLSATATATRHYVDLIAGSGATILDTRKTLPGLRHAQKYAVRCGGGRNHRIGLFDAILIKENHIAAAGSINAALLTARASVEEGVKIEVEVEDLAQLEEALLSGCKRILLDNMPPELLRRAVELNCGRAKLEASGGITDETIVSIAATGVDYISIGSLTKDIRAVDLSMRLAEGVS